MKRAGWILGPLLCCAAPAIAAQSPQCPAAITVSESAARPPGWTVSAPKVTHPLAGIAVVNGPQGEEDAALHPDGEKQAGKHLTQSWQLADYRDRPLHLLCRYADTAVTLSADLPEPLKMCELTFPYNKLQGVIIDPDDPLRMSCR